jgi:uncharacterized protein
MAFRHMTRAGSILAAIVVAATVTLGAQALPRLTAPVNDLAHVIDASSAAELDKRIRALQTASGDAVVVATVPTMAPYSTIEEYAVKLFEQAGIGSRSKDNGLLVVLAVDERKIRIEVGYGLEEFITDGFSGDTIRQVMLPEFRQGRYGPGLLAGTTRIIQRIAERRGVTLTDVPAPARERGTGLSPQTIVFLIVIAIIVINSIRRSGGGGSPLGRRRPWGGGWSGWNWGPPGGFGGGFGGGGFGGFGGGGGGGFGGFGGGRSGGGGASGGW